MASEYLEHKLALLPDQPGCYLMKNANAQIIYVGKAKNLKNRVRSYFKSSHTGKVAAMVEEVADFETIVTSSNKESFLLEITLIQKHQPYYNIKLKRGTGYPYIKITNERDPIIKITAKSKKTAPTTLAPTPTSTRPKKRFTSFKRSFPYAGAMATRGGRACITTSASAWGVALRKCRKKNTPFKLSGLSPF